MSAAQTIAEGLQSVPPQLATLLLAAIPVGELRGALPIALTIYKLPLMEAAFWSVLGNMIPVYFLLIFFERASSWLTARSPLAAQVLERLHHRTRQKLEDNVEKYGPWALALFVAIPLPVTGAWTGSLAAVIFGIEKKTAFWAILMGILVAAAIVSALTLGATAGIHFLAR